MLLGFLMLPTFAYIGMVGASQTNLIDAGITDEMNPPLVLWEKLSDGRVLTVASDGNVSMNTFSNGQHGVQWTVQLEVNALCATVDAAEQLIAVGHGDGAYIIHIGLQVVNRNISIGRPVDDLNWDDEGDLWLVHFAGRRRAEEYNGEGATGIVSPNVQSGISSFLMLSNNYIMTASMDANV